MARILVTGSADGLGRLAAESLLAAGHDVVVNARNEQRAAALEPLVDRGAALVVADLGYRDDVRRMAAQLADAEPLDAVIHNAGVSPRRHGRHAATRRAGTGGRGPTGRAVIPVNVVAPYLLTALLPAPRRHVYLSSGSHFGGRPRLEGVDWRGSRGGSYGDSKLFVTTLAIALARLRPDLLSNAVDPGWVPTRMGGRGAPDDLDLGHDTQEWLATSDDPEALTSGGYWFHRRRRQPHAAVHDEAFSPAARPSRRYAARRNRRPWAQGRLLAALADETGVALPA